MDIGTFFNAALPYLGWALTIAALAAALVALAAAIRVARREH